MKDARDVRHRSMEKQCFLGMDGYQGYHQVEVDDETSRYLSFTCPRGSYRYLRGTMGTPGMPQHFQRVMSEQVLHGLDGDVCDVFVDDLPIYGVGPAGEQRVWEQDALENLRAVFERCRKHNVKLSTV